MKADVTYWNTNFDPIDRPKIRPNHWLLSLQICVLIGAPLLLVGAIFAVMVDDAWPRYVALLGAILWGVCGTWASVIRRRGERSWNEL
jgi:hypothetical protein